MLHQKEEQSFFFRSRFDVVIYSKWPTLCIDLLRSLPACRVQVPDISVHCTTSVPEGPVYLSTTSSFPTWSS